MSLEFEILTFNPNIFSKFVKIPSTMTTRDLVALVKKQYHPHKISGIESVRCEICSPPSNDSTPLPSKYHGTKTPYKSQKDKGREDPFDAVHE